MNILRKIIDFKKPLVQELKETIPIKFLEKSIYFNTPVVSMKEYLNRENASGIIAEFKRKSPSKGDINKYAKVDEVTLGYMQAGASALSVLTDEHFFGGKNSDLTVARKYNFCPILRKDFIFDEYQIFEAKSIGADVILLIAEVLSKEEVKKLSSIAKTLGLEVLLELHSIDQIEKINKNIDIIGVNNRNLKTFEVSIENSISIAKSLLQDIVKISESGIKSADEILTLKEYGYRGFLIGERFMNAPRPQEACKTLVSSI